MREWQLDSTYPPGNRFFYDGDLGKAISVTCKDDNELKNMRRGNRVKGLGAQFICTAM